MARTDDAETLSLEVFNQLRADIVSGRFEPGSRVSPAEMRARFAVSTGVVREAITRLEVSGLLRAAPNRGYYVPSLTVEDLHNLVEARVLNEVAALRQAVRLGDVEWESELVAAHHRMARAHAPAGAVVHRSNVRADLHLEFHLRLLGGCPNPVLLQICARLQDAAELYRGWAVPSSERDLGEVHRAILEAVLARDEDTAAALYEAHIRRSAVGAAEASARIAAAEPEGAAPRPRRRRMSPDRIREGSDPRS